MRATGFLVLGLLGLSAAGAHAQSGKIRICRYPGLTELMDRHAVPVPMGTGFVNGNDDQTGSELRPSFRVLTTSPVTLPPKPGCVVAPAEMEHPVDGFNLTTKYGKLPSQLNVAGLSVYGRVVADFR